MANSISGKDGKREKMCIRDRWGRISLERPPQRAEVTDWEGDDANEDEQ